MGRHIFAIMLVIWLGFQALVSRASYPIVIRFCPTCNARYDVQQMTFFCRDSLKCRHETIIEACDYKDHWGQVRRCHCDLITYEFVPCCRNHIVPDCPPDCRHRSTQN
ncbi:hypothetical protein PtA15_9A602 [Puccinia triticina]|uniref:Uncharacterized protein n=1 Tax=Puccinia triticina TaxID=208348 RepID=A0ABY7CXG4_9BASI|nr:uncharacterized protein PtA15_9A602 [Puccinia triticina]WAQ88475.1 hypothetical protein PtA15_9A602 [Puccinia triticina]